MVVAPGVSEELELQRITKGTGFDVQRDSVQKVNVVDIAKRLESKVEMADDDLRDLLKALFPEMPSYHIDALVAIAKQKDRKPNTINRLSKMLGGVM